MSDDTFAKSLALERGTNRRIDLARLIPRSRRRAEPSSRTPSGTSG